MEENKKLNPLWQKHICKKCGKESWLYAVNTINQDCPCIDCQLKELRKDK